MLLGSYNQPDYTAARRACLRWERTRAVSPRSLDVCRRDYEDRPDTGTRASVPCTILVRVGGFENGLSLA
jgi:hypothetical protein